jgi:hypothetical protein
MVEIQEHSFMPQVYRGWYSTRLAYVPVNLVTNAWYFFEIKVKFATTAVGTVEIRVNGESVLSLTGVQTVPAGVVTSPTRIFFGGSNEHMPCDVDDLYICDSAGSTNNDFLGDRGVKRLRVNGNGSSSDFVGSDLDSTDNYLLVEDEDPDEATWVGSGTSTDKDLYAVEDLASTPSSISAVSVVSYGTATDILGVSPEHVISYDDGGGADEDTDAITPWINEVPDPDEAIWGHLHSFFETVPGTSSAWTQTEVDAMEIGIQIA